MYLIHPVVQLRRRVPPPHVHVPAAAADRARSVVLDAAERPLEGLKFISSLSNSPFTMSRYPRIIHGFVDKAYTVLKDFYNTLHAFGTCLYLRDMRL